MVMPSASNQTMAFYSSTSNSPIQRRDIQCNTSNKGKQIKKHRDQNLSNFGMTDSELFKDLCSRGLMCLKPGKIWTTSFAAWFQVDLTCAYHWGTPGHSIESCMQFKNHVSSLLDAGRISLQGPASKKKEVKGTPRDEDTKKWDPKRDDQKLKEKNLELKEKNLELREENLQLKEENLSLRGEGQRIKDEMTRMERRELELRKENETYRLWLAGKQSRMLNLMAELKALRGQPNITEFRLGKSVQEEGTPEWKSMENCLQFASRGLHSNGTYALVSRKTGESFREYAQRWKKIAIDVQPPMTEQEVCRYFLRSLKDPRYDLMLVVPFEYFSQLITMGEDIDFETQEGHMDPLIGTQLNTMQGREVPNDPTSFANRLKQHVPITLNTSALSMVPRMPTKISPFSLDVSYLPPLPEYQKAIEPFNVPTIPLTCSPSPPTLCIVVHPFEPHLYTSNRIVNHAEGLCVKGLGFGVYSLALGLRVWVLRFRVYDFYIGV
ncbi:uncharacterized protein G2W53_027149 [Senna tora]|uniref:Uncharacterized protein n=1 Tax=Senna tora TaxID=362788 RepID=A0A834TIG1_9FABA|nr:uncharacterized protein G2W53_027149 [Senna tora]